MALIKCPECGKEVSDKAEKCIHCGKALSEDMVIARICSECGKENLNDATECVQCGCPFKKELGKSGGRKHKKMIIGILSGAVVVGCLVFFITIFCRQNNDLSINEISISKWRLIEQDKYFDDYEGALSSNETNPFIAVLGYYEEDAGAPHFVYMENGKGVVQVNEFADEDPSIKYKVMGYMNGKILKESDIKNIKYVDTDYNDYDGSGKTTCSVAIDIEMKKRISGMLFMELKNDLTKDIEKNIAVPIIHGKGKYFYYLDELPLKSRGVEVIATPKFFCSTMKLKESDYAIEKPFSVEKDEGEYSTSFEGKEELLFNGYDDGLIIYTEELIEGGDKKHRGEIYNRVTSLKDNQCTISTYIYGDNDEKMLMPKYNIQVIGYLKWNNYSK